MARVFGSDILTRLKDDILPNRLPAMITQVALERGDLDLEPIRKFTIGYMERQFPECNISMDDSELQPTELTMDILQTTEEYPVDVVIVLKDITAKTYLRQEYYIEALARVLHGYSDADITWILVKNGIRANMYTEQKETLRVVGVSLVIRTL